MVRLNTAVVLLAMAATLISCSFEGDRQTAAAPSFCPTHLAQALDVAPASGNIAPRAYYQDISTSEDTTLAITLYACDPNDVNTSEGLSWVVDSGPLSGNLSTTAGIYPDAVISYTPRSGFTGTDSFTYHVNDGLLDGNTAEILITVEPAPATAGSTWVRTYSLPNWIQARAIDGSSGGFILSGTSGWDIWAASLDASGALQWMTTLGDNNTDAAFGVEATSDGGAIITGQSFSLGPEISDIFVVKLGSTGNVEWEMAFGSPEQDLSYSVEETMNALGLPDGYVVSGYRGTTVNDTADIVVLRLDTDGSVLWQRSYDGGLNDLTLSSTTRQTADLGFIVAGMSTSFAVSNYDAWLLKLNADGTINWQRTIGVPGNILEQIRSVRQTSDGGYVLGGMTEEFDAEGDYWVVKVDAAGNIAWQKSFGGGGVDEAWSVEETSDGGYFVTGISDSFGLNEDAWLLKLDPDGAVQWQQLYDAGGNDRAEAGYQTPDDGYIVVGSTDSFSGGNLEVWVLKLDPNGQAGASCDFGTAPIYTSSDTSAIYTVTSVNPTTPGLAAASTSATVSTAAGMSTVICGGP